MCIKDYTKYLLVVLSLAVAIFLGINTAKAAPQVNTFALGGVTVYKGGTSTYCIDLAALQYDPTMNGMASVELTGTSTAHVSAKGVALPLAGTTMSGKTWYANKLPPGAKVDVWFNGGSASGNGAAVTTYKVKDYFAYNLDVYTGTTAAVRPIQLKAARYLFIDIEAGVTDVYCNPFINFAEGTGWRLPDAFHLGTRTYALGIAGTSKFAEADSYGEAIPEGAQYALIKSAESGNSLWVSRRTSVDRNRDSALQAGDVLPIEGSFAELKRITLSAAVANVKAIVEFYTRKPF